MGPRLRLIVGRFLHDELLDLFFWFAAEVFGRGIHIFNFERFSHLLRADLALADAIDTTAFTVADTVSGRVEVTIEGSTADLVKAYVFVL